MRWPWSRPVAPPPPDIITTSQMRRVEIGFFGQEWWEEDTLKDLRAQARLTGIDITGRRITYVYQGLAVTDPRPEDIITLMVTASVPHG